jgi:hypothetical protein
MQGILKPHLMSGSSKKIANRRAGVAAVLAATDF